MTTTSTPVSERESLRTGQVTRTVLRLRRPAGLTLVLAAVVIGLLAGIFEVAARSEALKRRLPPESIGSGQPQLDKKLVLLRDLIAAKGSVDALFVGSSQVYRAIEPDRVEGTFHGRAGREIRTFNFGLGGMSETGEAPLMRILVDEYRPRLVVVGASSYGLDERRDLKFMKFLDGSAWFRYHRGALSLDGWLLEHSVAFRRYHGHLFWANPDPETEAVVRRSVADMDLKGHSPLPSDGFRGVDPVAAAELRDYKPSKLHLDALADVVRLRREGLEVILVEMPVHESVIGLYGRGAEDHEAALQQIEKVAAAHGTQFWRYPYAERPIPPGGWSDFIHLNKVGTGVYSRWLGERLAAAAREGRAGL